MKNLQVLPKIRDSWTYVYVERCRIDRELKAVAIQDERGKVPIPCAVLSLLMAGPGTTVTHAAVQTLTESGCSLVWVGEEGVRCYAQGLGETRSSAHLEHQARLWADPALHLGVVRKLYELRFETALDPGLTLQQIRGLEGVRVRETYARASRETGVPWAGRNYQRQNWKGADPVNRALSTANSCLYGISHAAIVSAGYSPGLGFIHTGKQLSFVYDIADLYKAETSIPAAFATVAEGESDLEGRTRRKLRDLFRARRLLARIVQDIDRALSLEPGPEGTRFDWDDAYPGGLWDPDGPVSGGANYGEGNGQ